uniref:Uncharacterized protein n=1 Tax=Musa acuminata subsp. malaccensis TaxID=214687 RepID=A0A804I0P6_MUSAM
MGATGTGKSKLFIDLSAMFSGEVVNSDKIQVYRGLDITTNKIPVVERSGSNSFIHALLLERYDSRRNPFGPDGEPQRRVTGEEVERLRHRCCFLWVHVEAAVLA